MSGDPRCSPLVEMGRDEVGELVAPLLQGRTIASVERAEGGLTNTVYRIELEKGGPPLCLRTFPRGSSRWQTEVTILKRLGSLPIPELLLAGND